MGSTPGAEHVTDRSDPKEHKNLDQFRWGHGGLDKFECRRNIELNALK